MTLLTVVKRAHALVRMRRPNGVASAPDLTSASTMAELAKVEAEDLALRHDWDGIVLDYQFTTVAAVDQPGALPDDFARFPFKSGLTGPSGPIKGPLDKTAWRRLTEFPNMMGAPYGSFRVVRNGVQITPKPAAGQLIRFEYVTKNIYADADGNPKSEWSADADTCFIPEGLIALGVTWRWLSALGFDYAEAKRNAEMAFAQHAGTNGGGKGAISVGGCVVPSDIPIAYPYKLGPQ